VSELSANAILHTASGREAGSFHLALAVSSQVVALSVMDDGGSGSAPKAEHDGGHTVTAELFTQAREGGHPR
jgi:anti-sigma regulatory factor (Ser/Thr protein kinase)